MRKNVRRRYQNVDKIKIKLERYLKKYSIDHNAILTAYVDNMSPVLVGQKWPPHLGRRIRYRLMHQKFATYLVWLLMIAGFAFGEYYLYSREIKLPQQWDMASEFVSSTWQKLKNVLSNPGTFIDQKTSVESPSDDSSITP